MNTITTDNGKAGIELAKFTASLSIPQAVEGAKLPAIKRVMGEENLVKSIMVLIWDVVNFYNLAEGRTMNEVQVFQTAQFIIEDYKIYSLEDISLAFKNGKSGKYGKNYSTIDGQLLMGWLRLYDQDRDEALVKLNTFNATKEPILPDFVINKLCDEFVKPDEIKRKFNEDEYRKQRNTYLANQAAQRQLDELNTGAEQL